MPKNVLYIDMKKCLGCGAPATDIHHKNRVREDNRQGNLIALCKQCHGREHGSEAQCDTTIRFGDAYDMITNKSRVGARLREGYEMEYGEYEIG